MFHLLPVHAPMPEAQSMRIQIRQAPMVLLCTQIKRAAQLVGLQLEISQGGYNISVPKSDTVTVALPVTLSRLIALSATLMSTAAYANYTPGVAASGTTSNITIKNFYSNSVVAATWIVFGV